MSGERLCTLCLDLHRGSCLHPECPIGCTADTEAPAAWAARSRPAPTQPSIVAGGAREARATASGGSAPRRDHVATQPALNQEPS